MAPPEDRLKEAFALFDTDRDGFISHSELETVLRSLGHTPTQAEVRDLISEGTSGQYTARDGKIDFEFFCRLMQKKVKDDDTESELKDAFRVLDKAGQGWIGVNEIRLVCNRLGEDLTEDEVRDMISEAISNFGARAVRTHPAATQSHAPPSPVSHVPASLALLPLSLSEGKTYYDGFVKLMIPKPGH